MYALHIAAEVAHDVQRVRMQRAHVEPGRSLVGIADPHRHVDQQQVAQAAFLDPLFGFGGGRHKTMVEVDAVVDALFVRLCHHLSRLLDVVRDRLFAQDVQPGFQTLHRRGEVIAAVLHARRADAHGVELLVFEHLFDAVIGAHAVACGGLVGAFGDDVTHGDQLGQRVGLIDRRMGVADVAQADHSHFQHCDSPLW
jgi:hypothetical protein